MPTPTVSSSGKQSLDKLLKETVERRHVPGIFYGATTAKEEIYFNQYGEKVFGDASSGQIDADTTTECFSQTKLITCIAALQLIDQKLISLDSSEDIEKYLPEISELKVLKGYDGDDKAILEDPKHKVTLRMLMSHSAGFTYMFAENVLSKWHAQNPSPSLFDPKATVKSLCTPFIYEPGTSWTYSTSIDWTGKLVERVSGLDLEEYFQKNLFAPCGIKTLTFYPTEEIKKHKMSICYRDAEGKVQRIPNNFGMGRPTEADQVPKALLSGGGGLFGTQRDYLTFLRHLLQCDPSSPHRSDRPLISPESWKELFTPSIPKGEGYTGLDNIVTMVSKPEYIHPPPTIDTINHSVGFLLTLEEFTAGRKAGSGCWSGAAKTQFWIDPKTGIAAVCGTQLLSPSPDPWYASYVEFERTLYAALEQ
ncbi:uncharacterized protein I303_108690 [Kwoniella dejecticola CBS 10117]|uniref:Beta-lactamase-related domain-containing protein n=1 Tax=Kwoniella dejecticola CBS 10117 TaxID=1296121 RepID=A0A1A5ZWP2_9TREE|nr:uncharacterized protein I303_06985 [Kwoniella dejecticola CBS 10117]OBR82226.1 hypothetical protein I303_06985 [Kwoniella dejecticola CBS 10117]